MFCMLFNIIDALLMMFFNVLLQNKLGHALNRVSFYYSGISQRGGSEDMTSEASREKALAVIDEAIQIFKDVCSASVLFNSFVVRLQTCNDNTFGCVCGETGGTTFCGETLFGKAEAVITGHNLPVNS